MKKAVKKSKSPLEKDAIVQACINFQQARRDLARYQGTNDLEALDRMSSHYYNLVNKLLAKTTQSESKTRGVSVRKTLITRMIRAFKGSKNELSVQEILDRVIKSGWKTSSKNPRPMVWVALSNNPTLFRRVGYGKYNLKVKAVKLAARAKSKSLTT